MNVRPFTLADADALASLAVSAEEESFGRPSRRTANDVLGWLADSELETDSWIGLGVDSANPTGATKLYQSVGMHVETEFVLYEKQLQ